MFVCTLAHFRARINHVILWLPPIQCSLYRNIWYNISLSLYYMFQHKHIIIRPFYLDIFYEVSYYTSICIARIAQCWWLKYRLDISSKTLKWLHIKKHIKIFTSVLMKWPFSVLLFVGNSMLYSYKRFFLAVLFMGFLKRFSYPVDGMYRNGHILRNSDVFLSALVFCFDAQTAALCHK
jgi:hypothetical protein